MEFTDFLPGIGDLIGLSEGKKAAAKNRKFQWKVLQQQNAWQKEFAQQGLRWRVQDAQAAGLHPLSALGAQGLPSYSPVGVESGSGPVDAAVGRGIRLQSASKAERAAQVAALAESASRSAANEAEAGYYRAMEAKLRQEANALPAFPEVNIGPDEIIGNSVPNFTSGFGPHEMVAPKISESRPDSGGAIVAGPGNPSLREYILPGGFKMMLPDASSLGEALEPLSESMALGWGIYKENVRVYGEQWREAFIRRYGPDWYVGLTDAIGRSQDRQRRFWQSDKSDRSPGSRRERRMGGM